jgi:hypothetical protein
MANDFDNNRRLHGAHFGSAMQSRNHRNVFAKSTAQWLSPFGAWRP